MSATQQLPSGAQRVLSEIRAVMLNLGIDAWQVDVRLDLAVARWATDRADDMTFVTFYEYAWSVLTVEEEKRWRALDERRGR